MWAIGQLRWEKGDPLRIREEAVETTQLNSAKPKATRAGEEMIVVGFLVLRILIATCMHTPTFENTRTAQSKRPHHVIAALSSTPLGWWMQELPLWDT